jgi:hypothetical protein
MLFLSSARGYLVGGDLINYIPLFDSIAQMNWKDIFSVYTRYGYIFTAFVKASSMVSTHHSWYLFTFSLVNLTIPFYFICKYSKAPWLSLFMYVSLSYYTNTFNSVRSSFSLAMGIICVMYILKNKYLKAFLWAIIAVEIHKTIAPIFLLFFFRNLKLSMKRIFIYLICSFAIVGFWGYIISLNLSLLYDSTAGNTYNESLVLGEGSGRGYGLLIYDIIVVYICLLLIKQHTSYVNHFLFKVMVLATFLQSFAPSFSLITRVSYFFTFYQIILVPNCLYDSLSGKKRMFYMIPVMAYCLMFFIGLMTIRDFGFTRSNGQGTIPYYFYWEKRPVVPDTSQKSVI